jgi:hypothetical protein
MEHAPVLMMPGMLMRNAVPVSQDVLLVSHTEVNTFVMNVILDGSLTILRPQILTSAYAIILEFRLVMDHVKIQLRYVTINSIKMETYARNARSHV